MGRNGMKAPIFQEVVRVVNENVNSVITSDVILLGQGLGRNAVTSYLYRLVKLGYLEPVDNGPIKSKTTKYRVARRFSDNFTSVMLKAEMAKLNTKLNKNSAN